MTDRCSRFPFPGGLPRAASLVFAVLLLLAPPASAQDRSPAETLRPDRPGLGDGSWVVAPGVWQAELGGTLRDAGTDEFLTGDGLLRLGLSGLELRVFLPSLLVARSGEDLNLGDVGVGVKLPLASDRGWSWALTGAATLPTSTLDGASDETFGAAGVVAETSLSETAGLALNAGYGFPFDDLGDGTFSILATPGWTLDDGLGAYAGYAGSFGGGGDAHVLEAGLTKVTDADTQWDVNAGWDVENDAYFLGIGLTRRWR